MTNSEKIIELLKQGKRVFLKKNNSTIAMIDNDIFKENVYFRIGDGSIYTNGLTILYDTFEEALPLNN